MAILSATLNNVNVTFRHNPKANLKASTSSRVVFWLNEYLCGQEGIFRISKLVKDSFEFLGKAAQFTRFAGVGVWTSFVARIAGHGVTGTTLPHLYNVTFDLIKNVREDGLVKAVKRTSDVVAGAMFGMMVITSSAVPLLAVPAGFVVLAGDLADLYVETEEGRLLNQAIESKKEAIVDAADEKSVDDVQLSVEDSQRIVKEAQFLQMLKTTKASLSVIGGLALVLECALPLAIVSTAAMFTRAHYKLFTATLTLLGSVLAVGASYYKATSEWQVSGLRDVKQKTVKAD